MGTLRGIMNVLILILIAMVSFLVTMRLAIHGREVSVPSFLNMNYAEAQKLADAKSVKVVEEDKFYSATVPVGMVLSQEPAPGTAVRKGFRVQLAISLGPQVHTIPDLMGQSQRAAELNARQHGLELGSVATITDAQSATGSVLGQSPAPNAAGVASPKVSLLLAQSPEQPTLLMPDLAGMRMNDARALIEKAGLTIENVSAGSANGSLAGTDWIVTAQSPATGQRVSPGTQVKLTLQRTAQ